MKKLILVAALSVTVTGCAGFWDRAPHYLAIADSALTESAKADAEEEAQAE